MPTLDVINLDKKKVGTIELSDTVFGGDVNVALVHQVINAQLAGRRQGTHQTKTQTDVSGGGKKPFRQKGTGNARTGSTRSSVHVGGGQQFGPMPRSYEQRTPKKMVNGALRSALTDRVKSQRVLVVDSFDLKEAKTKAFAGALKKLDVAKVLIVDDENMSLELSGRNLPNVRVLRTEGLNVYDIIKHEWLVMSKRAAAAIDSRLQAK